MKPTTWMYVGAVILFIMSICGIGWGGIMVLGSTAPNSGQAQWGPLGGVFMFIGVLMVISGIVLVVSAGRKARQDTPQNVTLKVDLPGETKIEQMTCRSCGGALTADNIKMVNGAPVVTCPYCNSVYQLTEEPKW
jgi:hypothetical protein